MALCVTLKTALTFASTSYLTGVRKSPTTGDEEGDGVTKSSGAGDGEREGDETGQGAEVNEQGKSRT